MTCENSRIDRRLYGRSNVPCQKAHAQANGSILPTGVPWSADRIAALSNTGSRTQPRRAAWLPPAPL